MSLPPNKPTMQYSNVSGEEESDTPTPPPFSIHPGHFLVISAIPLCAGAFIGYRRELKIASRASKEASEVASKGIQVSSNALSVEGRLLAFRALSIATMMTLGGAAFVGALAFYASGHESIDEASRSMRKFGRRLRNGIEEWSLIDVGITQHPDFEATKSMTETEEIEYLQKKYLADVDKPMPTRQEDHKSR